MLQVAYRQEVLSGNRLGAREDAPVGPNTTATRACWSDGVTWTIPAVYRAAAKSVGSVTLMELDHQDNGSVLLKEMHQKGSALLIVYHKLPHTNDKQITQLVLSSVPEEVRSDAIDLMKELAKAYAAGASKLDVMTRKSQFKESLKKKASKLAAKKTPATQTNAGAGEGEDQKNAGAGEGEDAAKTHATLPPAEHNGDVEKGASKTLTTLPPHAEHNAWVQRSKNAKALAGGGALDNHSPATTDNDDCLCGDADFIDSDIDSIPTLGILQMGCDLQDEIGILPGMQ